MYSQDIEQKKVSAQVRNVPISRKKGVELAKSIRNKKLEIAYQILNGVISLKKAVPYKRYNMDKAHKRGIGPGGFPVKCATYFLKVLKNAEANAVNKGLSKNDLYVSFISVDKGQTRLKAGRLRGRRAKNAHIKIVLAEKATTKKLRKEGKPEPKKEPKKETKTAKTSTQINPKMETKTKKDAQPVKKSVKSENEKEKVVNAHD